MTDWTEPLVTVVVPAFNVQDYLPDCLASVLGQAYANLEVVLVDDGSTDRTNELAQGFGARDTRVRVLRHEVNRGLSAARNTGIVEARGDYITFVDSDDLVRANLVELCVAAASCGSADLVTYGYRTFSKGQAHLPEGRAGESGGSTLLETGKAPYFDSPYFAWLKFVRTDVLRRNGLRFPPGVTYEDHLFHWELGLCASRIVLLDEVLYDYRLRNDSITASRGAELLDIVLANERIADRLNQEERPPEVERAFARRATDGLWYVYLNIDDDLLPEAVSRMSRFARVNKHLFQYADAFRLSRRALLALLALDRQASRSALIRARRIVRRRANLRLRP